MGRRPPALADVDTAGLPPAPWTLSSCLLGGIVAVLLLPEVASALPRGDRPQPNEAQLAVVALAVLIITGAYLFAVERATGLSRPWLVLAFSYNAAIVVVKFIVSPASFHNSADTTLSEYLWVGVTVMFLYVVGLGAVFAAARRHRGPGAWRWGPKLGVVALLLVFGVGSRYFAAVALGRTASDYLRDVFTGAGLWLPALLAGAALLAVEAFDRAAHSEGPADRGGALATALVAGIALIVLYHGLWVILMLRLF